MLDCPTMLVNLYPIHYDDIYFREVAPQLLAQVAQLDDETCALTLTCAAYNCEADLMRN